MTALSPILQARHLEKTIKNNELFERKWTKTLWRIESLSMTEPGFYLLAGRNGSGKSTLLRSLLGLVQPTKGEILWYGKSSPLPGQIGYVPEFPVIPPSAKVEHWISWLTGIKRTEILKRDDELSQKTSLSIRSFLEVPSNQLSKGQQQRIQLWSALASNPAGLVLDEPFSGLDPWARQELTELLIQVLENGKFILMSTHEITQKLRMRCLETWMIENEELLIQNGCTLPA